MNTFHGANQRFANRGIHFLLAEVVKFRKQLMTRPELKSQSGWNNALNHYMMEELNKLADTLENITYNPDDKEKEQLEAEAADTLRSLEEDYNERAISVDNVVVPTGRDRPIVWKLDGSDPDIPLVSPETVANDFARAFVTGLDNFFVEATRIDSRHQPQMITRYESHMLRSLLNELFTICQRKGGEANRSDIPNGTLPSDESQTFNGGS